MSAWTLTIIAITNAPAALVQLVTFRFTCADGRVQPPSTASDLGAADWLHDSQRTGATMFPLPDPQQVTGRGTYSTRFPITATPAVIAAALKKTYRDPLDAQDAQTDHVTVGVLDIDGVMAAHADAVATVRADAATTAEAALTDGQKALAALTAAKTEVTALKVLVDLGQLDPADPTYVAAQAALAAAIPAALPALAPNAVRAAASATPVDTLTAASPAVRK